MGVKFRPVVQLIVYFDGVTAHAARLDQKHGEALCGFPPRRPDGTQWSLSDEIPATAKSYILDEPYPLVDCEWCHQVYEASGYAV